MVQGNCEGNTVSLLDVVVSCRISWSVETAHRWPHCNVEQNDSNVVSQGCLTVCSYDNKSGDLDYFNEEIDQTKYLMCGVRHFDVIDSKYSR